MMFCPDSTDLCVLASLREIINVRGNTYPVAYEYDTLGRMVAMATTRDNKVDFAAIAVELANGASLTSLGATWPLDLTQWHYDAATGLLTQKLYADGKGTAYSYTPEGKLARRTWARGVTTTYNYDAAGNLVAINYSDNTPNVSFSYDRLGRQLSAIVDGISTNLYTYDHETLMLATENQNGMLINRASDTFGRPVGFTMGQDYGVTYAYDEFGRFASVSSSASLANLAVQYSYLPNTDIIAGYTSGDFTRTVAYEPARSLITAVENKFGNATISRYDYTNDELGRRTAIARSGNAFGDTPVTDSYGYNLRSEVTSARRTLTADPTQAVPGFSHDYAYDPIGNRIVATNNQEVIAYTANSLNQYTAVNETEPVYDDDGNLLSDGRFNYTWNGENRLVVASNETYIVSYAYDHQGRMVWKQIADNNAPTKNITYTWDDFNIVTETIGNLQSTIRNYNVWGLDLSQSLQGAGGVGGLLAVISPLLLGEGQGEGSMALPCYDANGNITEYIDGSGTIAAHYEYSPFGEIAVQTGSIASTFTHRFSTKPWCAVTGFSEYEYRKYCPSLGRWLSRDPIGEWGSHLTVILQDKLEALGIEPNMYKIEILYTFLENATTSKYDFLGMVDYPRRNKYCCCDSNKRFNGRVTISTYYSLISEQLTIEGIEPGARGKSEKDSCAVLSSRILDYFNDSGIPPCWACSLEHRYKGIFWGRYRDHWNAICKSYDETGAVRETLAFDYWKGLPPGDPVYSFYRDYKRPDPYDHPTYIATPCPL